jgi:nucleoid-associated protein YgaU
MPDPNRPKADFSGVKGGSSSTAPDAALPAAPQARTHTVVSGESLSKIAKHYYGNASKWRVIYEANQDKIKNPDLIHPGQEFIIPDLPSD